MSMLLHKLWSLDCLKKLVRKIDDAGAVNLACETVKHLKVKVPHFIPPNLCPPNSPNLNTVTYKICGMLQERVYKKSITTSTTMPWKMAQTAGQTRLAVGIWQKGLRACVAATKESLITRCDVNIYHYWYLVSECSDTSLWSIAVLFRKKLVVLSSIICGMCYIL